MIARSKLRELMRTHLISLRTLEDRDHEAILELFSQPICRKGMVTDPFKDLDDIQAWLASQGPQAVALVATSEDRAIGVGLLVPGQDFRQHVGGLILFVHDAFHRRGVGTRLLKALMTIADRDLDLRRTELWVLCDNDPAVQLYRKFGFEVEGRHDCFAFRGGESVDVYTMGRVRGRTLQAAQADQVAEAPLGLAVDE